jgi:16S rRNA (guanine(966)-N(2))-methyltransferase RsmD
LRERVFAIVGERCREAQVLDTFSGTGAVVLEALSRGAAGAVAVEQSPQMARVLEVNVRELCGSDPVHIEVWTCPWKRALRRLQRDGRRFDLMWADPPFERWRDGLGAIASAVELDVLTAAATACLECPRDAVLEEAELIRCGVALERDVRGGASRVAILRRRERARMAGSSLGLAEK